MSHGAVSHYSPRNLDAFMRHLGSWSPFVPPPASIPTDSDFMDSACDIDHTNKLLECAIASTGPSDTRGRKADLGLHPLHLVKCCLKQAAGTDRWPRPPFKDTSNAQGLICHHQKANDVDMSIIDSIPVVDMLRVNGSMLEDTVRNGRHGASNSSDGDKVPALSGSLSGWSRKHKQLSRALARGLWRWREDSRARKRRRKGGSSRSGSGRSSDSRRARVYASDPLTVGASAACATCSDIPPMPGTDSSGELFFHGDSGGISWDPEFFSSCEGIAALRRDGMELYHAWLASDTPSLESGYGSEPGYRGDGELGYEDDGVADEQDEEEREQLPLSPWRESSIKSGLCTKDGILFDEDCWDDPTSSSDIKMQQRLRRRRQDCKSFPGLKNGKHF